MVGEVLLLVLPLFVGADADAVGVVIGLLA